VKILYSVLGSISLALGILGIFLPVLPTTPFLLLSASLYLKGSEKLYNWLMNHPKLGPYITNFRIHKSIPLKAKIISILMMWITILITVIYFIPLLPVKILLLLIAIAVTIHILSFKTLK